MEPGTIYHVNISLVCTAPDTYLPNIEVMTTKDNGKMEQAELALVLAAAGEQLDRIVIQEVRKARNDHAVKH